jgi:pimeloyl-ACP methyl ester carboxylesterase
VDKSDPPLLMLHGDQDPQVPINQSHELHAAYKKLKLDGHLEVIHGGVHGGHLFHDAVRRKLVTKFLDAHLKKDATP